MAKKDTMEIIRGTTPTIIVNVLDDIDLSEVISVWIYIAQGEGHKRVIINREKPDTIFDFENRTMQVRFEQEDTLGLKEGDAKFQIRLLIDDGSTVPKALAMVAQDIRILEIYKEGVIT